MARIWQAFSIGDAQIRAALVDHPGEADLCVHRVTAQGLARGDSLWFITRDRQNATARVCFCSRGMAQIRICFVDTFSAAGWSRAHPLKGCF